MLFLDDLDCIMSAATGPEQEMSGEAQYYTKNAEGTILMTFICQSYFLNIVVIKGNSAE